MSEGRGIGLDRTDRPRLRDRHRIVDDLNIFPQLGARASQRLYVYNRKIYNRSEDGHDCKQFCLQSDALKDCERCSL